jgi:hypothetical protein
MRVRNVQRRTIGSPEQCGALLDGLASDTGRLWPGDRWPRLRLGGACASAPRAGTARFAIAGGRKSIDHARYHSP